MNRDITSALAQFSVLPDNAFVGMPVVCALLGGITPKTIYDRINNREIDKPFKLGGGRKNFWRVGYLRQYLAEQARQQIAA